MLTHFHEQHAKSRQASRSSAAQALLIKWGAKAPEGPSTPTSSPMLAWPHASSRMWMRGARLSRPSPRRAGGGGTNSCLPAAPSPCAPK